MQLRDQLRIILIFIVISLPAINIIGQCYELVWSDEFDYTGFPDTDYWTSEVGGSGWGNNELQYYTENDTDNAMVNNGTLTITARRENIGGKQYSSARLITRDKFSFQYGKIESLIKLPFGQGIWPAFWMLGDNYGEVGWPGCGEIDIMELVGGTYSNNKVHGTVHWEHANGDYASYGNHYTLPTGIFADDYHLFSIEWTPTAITWKMDGIQYHIISITDQHLSEFHQDFFLLLNIAVGGNWPGNPDGTTIFPQTMEVDYVRVYKSSDKISDLAITGDESFYQQAAGKEFYLPESPDWTYSWTVPEGAMIVAGDNTSRIFVNWGCLEGSVQCSVTGTCDTYDFEFPVSLETKIQGPDFITANEKGIQLYVEPMHGSEYVWTVPADASIVSGQNNDTLIVDWGLTYSPVSLIITNSCGTTELEYLPIEFGKYPYPDINQVHLLPGTIEAVEFDYGGEGLSYHDTSVGNNGAGPRQDTNVDTEYSDNDSPNVGWIANGEWLEYLIRVDSSAYYEITARVATANGSGGPFSFHFNGEERLNGVKVSNTGGWATFVTKTLGKVSLTKEDTLMKIYFNTGGFNLGKLTFSLTDPVGIPESGSIDYRVFPVPAEDHVEIAGIDRPISIELYDINGRKIKQLDFQMGEHKQISLDEISNGIYFLQIISKDEVIGYNKIIKSKH